MSGIAFIWPRLLPPHLAPGRLMEAEVHMIYITISEVGTDL